MPFLRDTSTISDVVGMVKEETLCRRGSRACAAGKSGQASSACQARSISARSSAVRPDHPNSVASSSSTRRCTSSMLKSGQILRVIILSARRRYSLVAAAQSAAMPRRAPAAAKAAAMPRCQSRIVPPVSKVRTLIADIISSVLSPGAGPACRVVPREERAPCLLIDLLLEGVALTHSAGAHHRGPRVDALEPTADVREGTDLIAFA